jgi:hypothetical protein
MRHIPFPVGAYAGWMALSAYCALFPALWIRLGLRLNGDDAKTDRPTGGGASWLFGAKAYARDAWAVRASGVSGEIQSFEPNYEGSPLVVGSAGGAPSAVGSHSFKARAGHHLAPQTLSSGRNVFEELGEGFTLLAFGAGEPDIAAFEAAARARQIPLKVLRDSYAEGRMAYEARLILVRPDAFVAFAGDAAQAEAILATVVGA